jgi:RNA polymerase sigma-70 factor (ECF subfamily)
VGLPATTRGGSSIVIGAPFNLPDRVDLTEPVAVVHPDPIGDLSNAEEIVALRRAVLSLPVRYREVVVLCDLENLSYVDAASALECAVGTVRSRLHRGRALLEAKMRARLANGGSAGAKRGTRCLA